MKNVFLNVDDLLAQKNFWLKDDKNQLDWEEKYHETWIWRQQFV